jgi:hypothetical protein
MSMLDKISRLVAGGERAMRHEAAEVLQALYAGCVGRAGQLERHAELAPQPASAGGLRELAHAEERQAERLAEALRAAGERPPSSAPTPPSAGALNHWARLVQDLEAHRSSERRLRELAAHFAETLPETAALFDELCREEHAHCLRLRALIARADPQALD